MKKVISIMLLAVMALGLIACGASAPAATEAPVENVAMQYVTVEDAKALLENDEYVFFDIRKAADSSVATVPGAQAWDMDAAKEGDAEAGKATMTEATKGLDKKIILVCYSGKRYAQAATNALSAIGYDMSKVYTLEGGFTAWSEQMAQSDAASTEETAAEADKTVYVSAEWVKSVIDGNEPESKDYVILECAWGGEEFDPEYTEAHIPGAVHMNTDLIEEEVYWNVRTGAEIEQVAKDFGITKDTTVIVYSSGASNSADDRVAFVMLWAGVENVKALDGGFESWTAAGYETESGSVAPVATDKAFGVAVPAHPEYILSPEQVADKVANDANFRLVSIRSWDEYTGVTSGYGYIPKAGEPKGAIWGHDTDDGSYLKDGLTANVDTLAAYLAEEGASMTNELSFYCGTGWRATIPFLLAYEEGYTNISLYDGGWFVWQMMDEMEVQVGDPDDASCVYTTVGELSDDKAAK